jgi:hypothetical protein
MNEKDKIRDVRDRLPFVAALKAKMERFDEQVEAFVLRVLSG